MNHAEQLVDIVTPDGTVVSSKPRQAIDKAVDLYHTVFIILITPDKQFILSKIPKRVDLPNLYAGTYGQTVATIRRHDETADQASLRALKNELYIEDAELTSLGDTHTVLPDGHKKYMSVYYGVHNVPEDFSHSDIEALLTFDHAKLANDLRSNKDQFAPTFLAIWEKHHMDLLSI